MSDNEIKCPQCGHKIPIDDVLKHRLNEQVNSEVARRLENEKNKLTDDIKAEMSAKSFDDIKIFQEKLKIESEKRNELEKRELDFIRKQSDMEDKIKHQDLEIARKMAEEKKLIEEKVRKEEEEKQNFMVMELKKQLDDQKKLNQEMNRKLNQGSMQTQGEVLELALEEILKKKFPHDEIEPVGKGISGADIIQKVYAANGECAGIIAWESKQTKAWTEDWVAKLKDDGHRVKANLLILVTNVLPKNIERFGQYKEIWVTDYLSAIGLASALRNNLLSVYSVALANENSQDKAQLIYKHLTSQTFSNRVRTLAETFLEMKTLIEKEKRAFDSIWSAREKQIERLSSNTSQIFGEIQGIAGGNFTGIEVLEELGTEKLIANNHLEPPLAKQPGERSSEQNKKNPPENQANLF